VKCFWVELKEGFIASWLKLARESCQGVSLLIMSLQESFWVELKETFIAGLLKLARGRVVSG